MGVLPKVNISYDNGAIAQAVASNDGLLCIAVIGYETTGFYMRAGEPVLLTSVNTLTNYGMTLHEYDPNGHIYTIVRDFYSQAPEGTRVYLVVYPETLTMSEILSNYDPYLSEVFLKTKKEIRGFVVARKYKKGDEENRYDDGTHFEPMNGIINANHFGNWATETHNAPVFVLLENYLFEFFDDSLETRDLKEYNCNRVGLITGTSDYSHNQAVGLVAGRISVSPVHRHIGRVKSGALKADEIYISNRPVTDSVAEILSENNHITFRSLAGKAGFFVADDCLCSSDDYCSLTRRRTIDKAYRIAYALLVEELNDEIPVNGDGTMLETYATAFEQMVENAIALNMTRNGELSSDPTDANDNGVICTVDRTVNVLATNQIKATLRVRPYGYAKYIDVLLGFTIVQ